MPACSFVLDMFWYRERHSTWKGLVAGAIGGAVASLAMNGFQAGMSKLFEDPEQPRESKRKAREAQGWKQHHEGAKQDGSTEERATVKTAEAVSEAFGHELQPAEKEPAGQVVHYAYGTAAGAVYGAMAEHWEDARTGEGTAFGAILWAVSDEVAVPALGLSKGPREYPLRTHAMALASHLVYGVTAELTRRVLRAGVLSK
jgi:putative membrane protein